MTATQSEKANQFERLHKCPGAFVIPNPWDAGSARLLAALGFKALATSSGAFAGVLGRRDGNLSREESLAQAGAVVSATDLPVSADLENGFGDEPQAVAETIRLAVYAGLAGASIEDAPIDKAGAPYDLQLAVERIEAAVEVVRGLAFPFILTARSENFLRGRLDLNDTIRRLQAFENAGAGAVFAPALPDLESVRAVCSAVSVPVNFMVGMKGKSYSVAELEQAGVKRISLAASLYRAALSGLVEAAGEIVERGTFGYVDRALSSSEINALMERSAMQDE